MRIHSETKPLDFLVIGAQKAGTTALFQYLRHHPRIYLPPQKELRFFSEDELFERGWAAFAAPYFGNAPTELLWGKITPEYMKHPGVIPDRILRLMPDIKLIAILRNPIDRAFSAYRMAVLREWKSQSSVSFNQIVLRTISSGSEDIWRENIVTLGLYARILFDYLRVFPREQLLILFTEELETQPGETIDSILSFLDLPPGFRPPNLGKRYHVGASRQRFPFMKKTLNSLKPAKSLWRRLPEGMRRTMKLWWFTEINKVHEAAPVISEEIRSRLVDYYQADVRALETIAGRKVPWIEFRHSS